MKVFLSVFLSVIAWTILTQVFVVPVPIVFGVVIFAAIVGYITG